MDAKVLSAHEYQVGPSAAGSRESCTKPRDLVTSGDTKDRSRDRSDRKGEEGDSEPGSVMKAVLARSFVNFRQKTSLHHRHLPKPVRAACRRRCPIWLISESGHPGKTRCDVLGDSAKVGVEQWNLCGDL